MFKGRLVTLRRGSTDPELFVRLTLLEYFSKVVVSLCRFHKPNHGVRRLDILKVRRMRDVHFQHKNNRSWQSCYIWMIA